MNVSVVIPTYKAAPFLRRTLGSVFAQTRPAAEVLVVDDASPDDTVAVAEEVAATAPVPVRVVRLAKNSGGPAGPLNAGVEAARGDWVAALDHDDLMTPTRLADQVAAAEACPGVGLVLGRVRGAGGRDGITEAGWKVLSGLPAAEPAAGAFRVAAADAYAAVLRHGCYAMTCSAMLFPKAAWRAVGGFDERIRTSCDLDLLQNVTRAHDLAYTPAVVAEWTAPPSTLYSAAGPGRRFEDCWIVLDRFARHGLPRGLRPEWRRAVRDFLFENGYAFRRAGLLRAAAACQWKAAVRCGPSVRLLTELLKIGAAGLRGPGRRAPA